MTFSRSSPRPVIALVAASATAQTKPKKIPDIPPPGAKPAAAAAPAAPVLPKPGPEHAALKPQAGEWDATVESFMAPGQPPLLSKGTETGTMIGDFWLVSDFKSDMMGQPFTGHGTLGYDPAKKKYVSTWIDSMTPTLSLGESDYDAATHTFTDGWTDGLDHRPNSIDLATLVRVRCARNSDRRTADHRVRVRCA